MGIHPSKLRGHKLGLRLSNIYDLFTLESGKSKTCTINVMDFIYYTTQLTVVKRVQFPVDPPLYTEILQKRELTSHYIAQKVASEGHVITIN